MKKIITLLIISFTIYSHSVNAQYVIKEADVQYELFNFKKAIVLYTSAYQKKRTYHATQRLAESYRLIQDYKQAESWYSILTSMDGVKAEDVLKYAEALRHTGKYSEAKIQFDKYAGLNKEVSLAQKSLWLSSCDSAINWMRNPKPVILKNEDLLNSEQSDWGIVNYENGLIFTSDRTNKKLNLNSHRPFLKFDGSKLPDRHTYGWTGNDYLRIYQQMKDQDSVSLFPIDPGTNYHIGSPSFVSDGNEVFFTLTRIPNRIQGERDVPTTINVELYSSKKVDGKWSKAVSFKYNSVNSYSVGDPLISPDGKMLYFVSNMPGGKGGTDIYKSVRNSDESWSEPENLSNYNSPGNERTPMVDLKNNFYFSSDGFTGMGGLDIFKAAGNNIENLGYPINSADDDFAFTLKSETEGYLSSNRPGGKGSDDIYSFIQKLILNFRLEGKVYDKVTKQPIANSIVSLTGASGNTLKVETIADGSFKFNLSENSNYTLQAEKTNFRADVAEALTTKGLLTSTILKQDLFLEQVVIGKAIKLDNIYYDFDKSNIRPDAAIELNKLVTIMKANPTIWIELGSHTDSRGNDQYNQWLSQSRANSAVQYIIDQGIEKSRIIAKGYGESHPFNQCTNGVRCTEAEHQLNRRTEFTITKQ